MFIICRIDNTDVYWSAEFGWVDIDTADRFTDKQQKQLTLPSEGRWRSLWEVDLIQFARFIAECEASGMWATPRHSADSPLQEVADSMDVNIGDVFSIIDRAQDRWDAFKASVR